VRGTSRAIVNADQFNVRRTPALSMNPPHPVRAAAALVVLRPIAGLLHSLYLGANGPPLHLNFWAVAALSEFVVVAIAYGLIRGSNVVRILLSVVIIGSWLFGMRMSLALFPVYSFIDAGFALGIVTLLFVSSSNTFFSKQGTPNQSPDPTA
jgi:hypothetical protein